MVESPPQMTYPPSATDMPANEYYANANYVSRHRTLGSVSRSLLIFFLFCRKEKRESPLQGPL